MRIYHYSAKTEITSWVNEKSRVMRIVQHVKNQMNITYKTKEYDGKFFVSVQPLDAVSMSQSFRSKIFEEVDNNTNYVR